MLTRHRLLALLLALAAPRAVAREGDVGSAGSAADLPRERPAATADASTTETAPLLAAARGAPVAPTASPAKSDAEPVPGSSMRLVVTLTWEGRDLLEHNLAAVRSLRERFPELQLVHLVSPAYFTRPGADVAVARRAIRSAMRPKDKLGVALGGWKSLARAAGVIFRNGPTFWGHELRDVDCAVDCGLEVPVNVYPQQEVVQLVRTAITTLGAHGFGRAEAATTTGWVASPQVLEAYAQSGIRYDFSAVAPELLQRRIGAFPLFQWARGLWPTVTPHTQPYVLPSVQTSLTEIPQSLAAVDYLEPKDVLAIFDEYTDRLRREPNRDLTFQLAFYQETAFQTVPQLTKALKALYERAAARRVTLQPLDVPGMALPPEDGASAMPLVH